MEPSFIFHIISKSDYEQAQAAGEWRAPSLATEGFIHFSTAKQTPLTAQRFYAGRKDVILLEIEIAKLKAELKFEKVYATEDPFPHLFGPMNLDAIVKVHAFEEQEDKTWKIDP